MRRPGGYTFLTDVNGQVEEGETFTCVHCNKIVHVPRGGLPTDVGGLCYGCNGLICSTCCDTGVCDPLEEKFKRMEEAAVERRRSYG